MGKTGNYAVLLSIQIIDIPHIVALPVRNNFSIKQNTFTFRRTTSWSKLYSSSIHPSIFICSKFSSNTQQS